MITVEITEDFQTGDKVVVARVPKADLVEIKLDPLDRAVLDTPTKTAADIFQDLEILARRQAEQANDTEEE